VGVLRVLMVIYAVVSAGAVSLGVKWFAALTPKIGHPTAAVRFARHFR
jgi:hypothetical protein